MHSVPISLFLVLFVRAGTGEHSLPSLPEAVQLLQLETIRGLKQTILEKEDENRRLEEIIQSVQMEKEAVTHNHTMMEEEMAQILSERENVIGELESRLQFLEKDGTIEELETQIQGLEMEKAAIEKQNVMEKEENVQKMVSMETEKTKMREEFAKKQMERDGSCQDEKKEMEDLKNKELDEISETLNKSEMTVTYMREVMLHSNQVMEEQENLLKVQAGAIQEFNEELNMGKNCSTLLGAAADKISLQEEAIDLLKSSLVTSRNFSELSTSDMDQLDVAPFMMEMLESYNQLAEMVENMKTALEKEGEVEAQTSELLIHLAELRSAMESASINMDMLEQQAKVIEMQGRSIALLTPLLRRSNSSDLLWFENISRSTRSTGEVGLADVAACSCLPRSASTNQFRPVRIDYQCQADTNRSFQLFCPGGVCSSRELPSCTDSLEWDEEEVGFEKCQELSFKGASFLCGINGTKETAKRLHIGGGIVEEIVSASCNDCGDLSAALEWTAWAPCSDETSDETSGRNIEGMLCRRRGNTYMGFEEEEIICAAPWTQLSTGCYRFHKSPLTQSEAKKFCEEELFLTSRITWTGARQTREDLHGHLVEIETEEENEELYNEAVRLNMTDVPSWIGLSDIAEEGNWVWTSGERANFTNWSRDQPDNAIHNSRDGENCAVLNTYTYVNSPGYWGVPRKWNDVPCSHPKGAICELIV